MAKKRVRGRDDSGRVAPAVADTTLAATVGAAPAAAPVPSAPARQPRIDLRKTPVTFLVVLAATLMAKAGALLPGYAIDDYAHAGGIHPGLLDDVISKGRLGHWLWLKIAVALQVEPNPARILYVSLAIVAYASLGVAVTRFWKMPPASWLTVAAACMVANHPYTAEIFTFRVGLPPAAMVMALLALLLHLAGGRRPHLLLGATLFAAALSFYQIALHFALMVVLLGLVLAAGRWILDSRSARPASGDGWTSVLLARSDVRFFLYVILGGLVYGAAGKLLSRLLDFKPVFFARLSPSELPQRLLISSKAVIATFIGTNVLIPPMVQLAFGVVLACAVAGMLWAAARSSRRLLASAAMVGALAVLACAFLWTIGVFLFLQGYWPVPRSMAHAGILWAGCLALGGAALPRAKPILLGAAAVILVSFVGVNQHIFEDQRRLNTRDLLEANRIVARLEDIPGAERVRRVAYVGGHAWYPHALQRTQWGDMNISAFGARWSQVPVLLEASGYNLVWATDPAEQATAKAYCAKVEPWPAAAAVTIQGELAIVCTIQH